MERKNILQNIIAIRKRKGFSQEYMAAKLNMKQSGYGLIENGRNELRYEMLLRIAIAYEMDVIDLITYPAKYIDASEIGEKIIGEKISLQIELSTEKKEQLVEFVFGSNRMSLETVGVNIEHKDK